MPTRAPIRSDPQPVASRCWATRYSADGVTRCGLWCGRERRSTYPASPSAVQRGSQR